MAVDDDDGLEAVAAGAVTALTLLVAFGLLAAGVSWFWIVFPVGFGGGLPLAVGLARLYQREDSEPSTDENRDEDVDDDALATLRERYARGELTDAEFERQVETLLETEPAEGTDVARECEYE